MFIAFQFSRIHSKKFRCVKKKQCFDIDCRAKNVLNLQTGHQRGLGGKNEI